MPNEWSHESGTSSNQITPGHIGIARHIRAAGSPLPGKTRWYVPTAGWVLSIMVHLGIAGVFLAVSFSGAQMVNSQRTPPTSRIEEEAEPLERIRPVSDLQMDPLMPAEILPEQAQLPVSMDEVLVPALGQETISVLDTGTSGSNLATLSAAAGQDAYQTSFCGTGGSAGCLCFVVDYSGSMVIAFDYVQAELKRSIEKLSPGHYFQIFFFAGGEPVEWPAGQLVRANRENREGALRFVEEMNLKPVESTTAAWQAVAQAVEKALRAKTSNGCESQMIYLLTDGEFEHEKVDQAIRQAQQQRDRPAIIHVLACGNPDNQGYLSRLARNNQGQYRFITDEEMALQQKGMP